MTFGLSAASKPVMVAYRMVFGILTWLIMSVCYSQPMIVTKTSLEVEIGRAQVIAIGRMSPTQVTGNPSTYILDVDRILKGPTSKQLAFQAYEPPVTAIRWQVNAERLLVIKSEDRCEVMQLTDPKIILINSNLDEFVGSSAIIRAIEKYLATDPNRAIEETANLVVMPGEACVASKPIGRSQIQLIVPLSKQTESNAQKWIARRKAEKKEQSPGAALQILSHFKSNQNIAILRSLLTDEASLVVPSTDGRLGYFQQLYPTREAAATLLKQWGQSVPSTAYDRAITWSPERVVTPYLPNVHGTDNIKSLVRFKNITDLSVMNGDVSDEDLASIGQLRSLKYLDIHSNPITDKGLAHLTGLPNLETLTMFNTEVSDTGLSALASIPNLHKLSLSGRQITDQGMDAISRISSLRELSMAGVSVSAEGLKKLKSLKNLKRLNIIGEYGHNGVTLACPKLADSVRALREVGMAHVLSIFDIGTNPKADKDNELETFWTPGNILDDDAIEELTHFPKLKRLNLSGTKLTEKGFSLLTKFERVSVLDVGYSELSDSLLRAINNMPALESLTVAGRKLTTLQLQQIAKTPNLKSLNVFGENLTNEDLKAVSNCKSLTNLQFIGGATLTDEGLSNLSNLPNLRSLNLAAASGLTDAAIPFLQRPPGLVKLDLSGTRISSVGIYQLLKANPKLELNYYPSY